MAANDWWTVLVGVVFLAAMAYTHRRDDVSGAVPPLIAVVMILALEAIGGFDPNVYTMALITLFLGVGVFRTWKERSPNAR